MKISAAFIFVFLFLTESALPNCQLVKKSALAVAVYASNWANEKTTRTPEGGPYKYKELLCKGDSCRVIETLKEKLTYEPGHPDADANGYVHYPAIDKDKEWSTVSSFAQTLRQAAAYCKNTTVFDKGDSVSIEYKNSTFAKLDIFTFGKNSHSISWTREDYNGRIHTHNF